MIARIPRAGHAQRTRALAHTLHRRFGEDGGYFRMVRGYDKTIPGFNCLGLRGACQAYIGKPPGADAIPSTRW